MFQTTLIKKPKETKLPSALGLKKCETMSVCFNEQLMSAF
ncbi:hypothetical protein LEP1GSC060_3001 [Leptospira weilii serovar Ranarum str. ICFT]|uniref:Uncharacterized protein n=1 Tax=Leptospira weilii serovar Ranarum str. ICFT TaxID=1218598 RepID=N1WAP9_9LEPT|nr:hypothetical protein LEP1GSC060_3001 [Leptospira weilii serovar Ranarum str. ICFT]